MVGIALLLLGVRLQLACTFTANGRGLALDQRDCYRQGMLGFAQKQVTGAMCGLTNLRMAASLDRKYLSQSLFRLAQPPSECGQAHQVRQLAAPRGTPRNQ